MLGLAGSPYLGKGDMSDSEFGKFKIDSESLPPFWTDMTAESIVEILKCADKTKHPLLVVLPPEANPATVAAFASLLLLPNMTAPPTPHCKIALAPGRHFIQDLKHIAFSLRALNRTVGKGRIFAEYKMLPPTIMKLNKMVKKSPSTEVFFHWVWRCDRVWDLYNTINRDELLPRNYFGRDDEYRSVLDLIESEELARSSVKQSQYDMLVYCPFYHRVSYGEWPERINHVKNVIENFKADRKIVIVRSPYDFWARSLEDVLEAPGFISLSGISHKSEADVQVHIIDHLLNIDEAQTLYRLIQRNWGRLQVEERKIIKDIHDLLKKVLSSLAILTPDESMAIASELDHIFKYLDLDLMPKGEDVCRSLLGRIRNLSQNPKVEEIKKIVSGNKCELWATRQADRKVLIDEFGGESEKLKVVLADKRMRFLSERTSGFVILTRVDRESDLDWVSHLKPGDHIILSSWELVTRAWTIERLWERSEEWRTNSANVGIIHDIENRLDPVLTLADLVTKKVRDTKIKIKEAQQEIDSSDEDFNDLWWDNIYRRGTAIAPISVTSVPIDKSGIECIEVRFKDGMASCFTLGHYIQIFRESEDDSEILTVTPDKLISGDVAIISKDEERGNILDIIMEHLSKSQELGPYASCVTKWKDSIRINFHRAGSSISNLKSELEKRGCSVDTVTIRSWVFGTVMAPRQKEHIVALAESLNILDIDLKMLDESLVKLRGIPRVIGRLLNQFITERSLTSEKKRELELLISKAGVDPDLVRASVDIKKVKEIGAESVKVPLNFANKLFKIN